MRKRLGDLALCLFVICFAPLLRSQEGTICGTVQNERGAPAAFTRVAAIYTGPHSGLYDTTKTDVHGHYCMKHVRPGEYVMSADDPVLGYPLLAGMFYLVHLPDPRITVSASSPHQLADWSIPYKAGFLHVHASDRLTGRAIPSVSLRLAIRGSEDSRYMFGAWAPELPVLLPPNEDIYITVNARGYKPWPTDESKGRSITVQPGGSLDIAPAMDAIAEP